MILRMKVTNNRDRLNPTTAIPNRRRGQRLRAGSKNTGFIGITCSKHGGFSDGLSGLTNDRNIRNLFAWVVENSYLNVLGRTREPFPHYQAAKCFAELIKATLKN